MNQTTTSMRKRRKTGHKKVSGVSKPVPEGKIEVSQECSASSISAKAAKALVLFDNKWYYERKEGKFKLLGGQCEPSDLHTWGALSRELSEEAGIKEFELLSGPEVHSNVAYYVIRAKTQPTSQPRVTVELSDEKPEGMYTSTSNFDFTAHKAWSIYRRNKTPKKFPFTSLTSSTERLASPADHIISPAAPGFTFPDSSHTSRILTASLPPSLTSSRPLVTSKYDAMDLDNPVIARDAGDTGSPSSQHRSNRNASSATKISDIYPSDVPERAASVANSATDSYFPGVDLNAIARRALKRRNLEDDGIKDGPGMYVYPDLGERIDWETFNKHIAWGRKTRGTVLIEAACADGKSSGIIKVYKHRVKEHALSLLIYIPRQTLAISIHEEYTEAGLKLFNYLQAQGNKLSLEEKHAILSGKAGIISPESTQKLENKVFKDVHFDEVCMTGRSIGGVNTPFLKAENKPWKSLNYIEDVCCGAEVVSAADADLLQSACVLDWFSRMCPEREIRILQFLHRPLGNRTVVLHNSASDVVKLAKQAIARFGQRKEKGIDPECDVPVWFVAAKKNGPLGVKKIGLSLASVLPEQDGLKREDTVLVFHGETGTKFKHRMCSDFTDACRDKVAVVANAALSVGINPETKFESAFIITDKCIPDIDTQVQSASRVNRQLGLADKPLKIHTFIDCEECIIPRTPPSFGDVLEKTLKNQQFKWKQCGGTSHSKTPVWFQRLMAHVALKAELQMGGNMRGYALRKFKHVGWQVKKSDDCSINNNTPSHDMSIDLVRESGANLATDAELYTHFMERGIDTEEFFNRDIQPISETRLDAFSRKLFFACRNLRGFPFTSFDDGDVAKGVFGPHELSVSLDDHCAIEKFLKDSINVNKFVQLPYYLGHMKRVENEITSQAQYCGEGHPEFTDKWRKMRELLPKLETLLRITGEYDARVLYFGRRTQGEADPIYCELKEDHKLVRLVRYCKMLTHKNGFNLMPEDKEITKDSVFLADIKKLTGVDILKFEPRVKPKNGTFYVALRRRLESLGLKPRQKNENAFLPITGCRIASKQIKLPTSITICANFDYWAEQYIKHPVSGLSVPQFAFDSHDEKIREGLIEAEKLDILTEEQKLAVYTGSADSPLLAKIDKDKFDIFCDRSSDELEKIVIAPHSSKKARLNKMLEWLSAAKTLIKQVGTDFIIPQKYHKTCDLKYNRLYSGGGTIQSCPRELRNALARMYYDDWDISSCHPTIVLQTAKKMGVKAPFLEQCVDVKKGDNKKKKVLDMIRKYYECDRKAAKELILRMLNGGGPGTIRKRGWLQAKSIGITKKIQLKVLQEGHLPFVLNLQEELLKLNEAIINSVPGVRDEYKRILTLHPGHWKDRGKDPKWSMFSWAVGYHEANILNVIINFIKGYEKEGNLTRVGTLIFDGLHILKTVSFNHEACQLEIKKQTGYDINLVKKPMTD